MLESVSLKFLGRTRLSYMNKALERKFTKLGLLPGNLPNLIIPGVQKAATSSLYHYLVQHPSVVGGNIKEMHFFDLDSKFFRGEKWYKQQFPHAEEYILDATPNYLYEQHIPLRIKETLGNNVRFIVVLREPVSRCFSAWNMYRQIAEQPERVAHFAEIEQAEPRYKLFSKYYENGHFPSFPEAVAIELQALSSGQEDFVEPGMVRRGFYHEQIEYWLSIFKREQFLFLDQESLRGDALKPALERITEFLSISQVWEEISTSPKHVRSYASRSIDPATEATLNTLYKRHNRGLPELTGLDLDWPCLND